MNLHQRARKAHKENEERGRSRKMINSKKVRRKIKNIFRRY